MNEALLKVQNPQCNDSMLAEFACTGTLKATAVTFTLVAIIFVIQN